MNLMAIDILSAQKLADKNNKLFETNFLTEVKTLEYGGVIVGLAGLYKMTFSGRPYLGLIPFDGFTARVAVAAKTRVEEFMQDNSQIILLVEDNKVNQRFAKWLGFVPSTTQPEVFTWPE